MLVFTGTLEGLQKEPQIIKTFLPPFVRVLEIFSHVTACMSVIRFALVLHRTPHCKSCIIQKNPRVRKIFVRNSGAGNGCANFMDAWKNASALQEKPMSIKFLVLGGGWVFWVLGGGGGEVPILFLWARGFL